MKKAFVVHGAWHHTNTLSTMIRIQDFRKITCFKEQSRMDNSETQATLDTRMTMTSSPPKDNNNNNKAKQSNKKK
jgi:hypothetical protein